MIANFHHPFFDELKNLRAEVPQDLYSTKNQKTKKTKKKSIKRSRKNAN